MTNDTNITNDKDINANISNDDHFNDSIVNEVILEDMKKNRIDHMKYLPDMEVLDSDIMDRVVAEMDAYDYDHRSRCSRGTLPRIPHIGGFQGSALACRTTIY